MSLAPLSLQIKLGIERRSCITNDNIELDPHLSSCSLSKRQWPRTQTKLAKEAKGRSNDNVFGLFGVSPVMWLSFLRGQTILPCQQVPQASLKQQPWSALQKMTIHSQVRETRGKPPTRTQNRRARGKGNLPPSNRQPLGVLYINIHWQAVLEMKPASAFLSDCSSYLALGKQCTQKGRQRD